jgi:hypothetical protein
MHMTTGVKKSAVAAPLIAYFPQRALFDLARYMNVATAFTHRPAECKHYCLFCIWRVSVVARFFSMLDYGFGEPEASLIRALENSQAVEMSCQWQVKPYQLPKPVILSLFWKCRTEHKSKLVLNFQNLDYFANLD